MNSEEKRQLKKLGKAEVEKRSQALDALLKHANPAKSGSNAWVRNYRTQVAKAKALRQEPPDRIPTAAARKQWQLVAMETDFTKGHPQVREMYYVCLTCGDLIQSAPEANAACACGGVFIDIDSARLIVEDETNMRLVRLVATSKR